MRRGHRRIGYIPQQRLMESGTPLRARDMIAQGVTGHRWGIRPERKAERERIDRIIDEVGATAFADAPVAELSGGEQQRTRVGQAIAADPALLLCDEPLISLDLRHQRGVTELIDRQRRQQGAAVLFVTHDVNPILDVVDRVLYIAGGRFRIGSPDEILRADVLSRPVRHPGRRRPHDGPHRHRRVERGPRAPPRRGRPARHRSGRRARLMDVWSTVFSFQDFGELVALVQNSIWAGAVLGVVGGLIGPFVVARNMPFAVHGISELSFAGASASLLLGVNVVTGSLVGSVVAALLIGLLGSRARDRNSIIAVLMPFGLGLGILCLALYKGRCGEQVRAADRADRLGRQPAADARSS